MPKGYLSTWRVAIEQLLSDGAWHGREEIVNAVLPSIPPGVALRYRASRLRTKAFNERRQNWDVYRVPLDRKIYIGRRALIMQTLSNMETRGVIAVDRDRQTYQIKHDALAPSGRADP